MYRTGNNDANRSVSSRRPRDRHLDSNTQHKECKDGTQSTRLRFLESVLGCSLRSCNQWSGITAYMNYLEGEFAAADPQYFECLWSKLGYTLPVVASDVVELMVLITEAVKIGERTSIDEVLKALLAPKGVDVRILDPASTIRCRQIIFKSISWLTTLFETVSAPDDDKFKIKIPFKAAGSLRDQQSTEFARRPISALVSEFGHILPTSKEISDIIGKTQPDQIHVSNLSVHSLRLIDKIRIEWTNSLGCHLRFNPLSRTLTLYRYPSFCALSCSASSTEAPFDRLLCECLHDLDLEPSAILKFKQEVLLSYRLLFGQTRKSRQFFRKHESKRVAVIKQNYDCFLDDLCGKAAGEWLGRLPPTLWPESCVGPDGRLLEQDTYSSSIDFPMLAGRLLKLQEFDIRQQPSRMRDLWRDRRNPLQWYTFWAVLIIGGISILLTFLQLVIAILQLVWSVKPQH